MAFNDRKEWSNHRRISSGRPTHIEGTKKHSPLRRYNSEHQLPTRTQSVSQSGSPKESEYPSNERSSNLFRMKEPQTPSKESSNSVFASPTDCYTTEVSPTSHFSFAETSGPHHDSTSIHKSDDSTLPFSEGHFAEAENEFRDAVRQHAQEVSGETQDSIELDHPIHKVKLELSSEQDMPIANTFGRRRSDARVRAPRGNVPVENIFNLAVKNAEQEAKRLALNCSTAERYVWEHGNRVLVTGQAGIGKSTLTRQIVQKILDGSILPGTQYIFYIKCRDIDFEEKIDLFDFFLKYSISDSDNLDFSPQEKQQIIKIVDLKKDVVVLFDGMDEAHTNDLSKSGTPKCSLKDVKQCSVLVRALMSGKLLPRAKVLITCRPRQAYQFSPEYRPGAVVQIMGLNTEAQQNLGKQICGQKDFATTYHMIHKDEDLESACYVTVFCMILYAVLHEANMRQNRSQRLKLNTITRVLIYLLNSYLRSEHMRDIAMEELRKIAELARKGFMEKRLVFGQIDLNEAGLSSSAFQAFLVTYLDRDTKLRYRIFEGEQRCSFSHQIWQEFFTAIDLMFFASNEVFDECSTLFTEKFSRWEVVAKFMYGLTNNDNVQFIQRQFLSSNFNADWQHRKKLLRTKAEYCIQRQIQDCVVLMQVCNWIQEADDYSFSREIANRLPQTFKIAGVEDDLILFNSDVHSIVRLLYAAYDFADENPVKNIDFENIEFHGDSFRHFASHMSRINGTTQELRLVNCRLGKAGGTQIVRFMHKAERLHIAYCDITQPEIALMREQYEKLASPRPEVWVFDENTIPCDFGQELRKNRGDWKRSSPVQHSYDD